jgi:hypothetical protein
MKHFLKEQYPEKRPWEDPDYRTYSKSPETRGARGGSIG